MLSFPLHVAAGADEMFFVVSKLYGLFFTPSHILLLLTVAAAISLNTEYRLLGRRLAVASAVLFVVMGFLPTGKWLARPLEDRFSRPDWPAHVDGILVLGGGLHPHTIEARGATAPEISETRLVAAYELARRYPNARVVFSGGSGELGGGNGVEANAAKFIFAQMGLDPKRLILESQSRNTQENIDFSKMIAKPRPEEVWVLATSAIQMPRAMHIAQRAHWKMIAWPTDYWTAQNQARISFAVPNNLNIVDGAVHEWSGLLVNR